MLQRTLQGTGVPVWRDTADLWPGEDWRRNIEDAIINGALVFVACFSRASLARSKSYQNEELYLAIEQLRLRRPDDPWLIPARFDECDIPDWNIGGGRTLRSLQWADLFGDRAEEGTRRLVASVLRILGRPADFSMTASLGIRTSDPASSQTRGLTDGAGISSTAARQLAYGTPAAREVRAEPSQPRGIDSAGIAQRLGFREAAVGPVPTTALAASGSVARRGDSSQSIIRNASSIVEPSIRLPGRQQEANEISQVQRTADGQSSDFVTQAPRSRVVPVTAEWALWGKRPEGQYDLVECSAGSLSRGVFATLLTRHPHGMINEVTVSCLPGVPGIEESYVAIAIHDRAHLVGSAVSRHVMLARYFCVPFAQLAAGTVTYQAMYEGFGEIRLPTNLRDPIRTELAGDPPEEATPDEFSMRTAALLLTLRPVCILGAEKVDVYSKLCFIDNVASLLPYGMRSTLSASTWISSIYLEHNFRLFFAAMARPQSNDQVIHWGKTDNFPIGDDYADDYLQSLREGSQERAAQLAANGEPMRFDRGQVLRMLNRLDIPAAHARRVAEARSGKTAAKPQPRNYDGIRRWLPSFMREYIAESIFFVCFGCMVIVALVVTLVI